jgi:adenylate kinase
MKDKVNIILFGPPGSGKGTQSEVLIKEYGLAHISTGDIIRHEIYNETPLAAKLRALPSGALAPDEIVIAMVENFVISTKNTMGFLFDGFPRTIHQAIALDAMLGKYNQAITRLISMDVPHHILIERIWQRGKTSKRNDDQNLNVINHRLQIYDEETLQVQFYYSKVNKVSLLNGNQTIPQVTKDIDDVMNLLFQ